MQFMEKMGIIVKIFTEEEENSSERTAEGSRSFAACWLGILLQALAILPDHMEQGLD